ncbi:testis-expressed sequence 11 protein [Plakobranchus ocellatus]|uniref:Protein ZIP4 homolog n=1 Tax=Plakobranchus ocellatus TaxID=259542 RepID=A0AAV4AFZ8_9GAST|nr:testis-expressed sequence 11 protein [Plakobranchus ocellatus]
MLRKLICWSDLKPKVNAYIQTIWQENWDAEGGKQAPRSTPLLGEDLSKRGEGAGGRKLEMKFMQNENTEAFAAVKKAEEMAPKFPVEAFNLSMLCYNFGVDCHHLKNFQTGISWLRESHNISKDTIEPNPKTQARTLRLLANCYLQAKCKGWKEAALTAVSLANQVGDVLFAFKCNLAI